MNPAEKYRQRAARIHSLVCVGLDSEFEKIPAAFRAGGHSQFEFNKHVIEQTHEFAAAYKFNTAFYEARGDAGLRDLKLSADYLRERHPDVFTICDAKRADIGNTNRGYVEEVFDWLGFDGITLHPYLGKEALQPFLDRADKGCIILCRTSNIGAREFQDLQVAGKPLWHIVAERVSTDWDQNHNCMLVVGATYPEELKQVRAITGDMTLLVPGVGAQGGDVEQVMKAGLNGENNGLIINSSRGIIFANDPRTAARELREEINRYR